jgi:putative transposase
MAQIARVVGTGIPHQISQRGNRRQATFFCAEDYQAFIEQNPVRSGLSGTPWEYPWSSAVAHVAGEDDAFITVAPLLALVGIWTDFLATGVPEDEVKELRRHEGSGRPLGREPFVAAVEGQLGRTLRRGKPGPKRGRPV